MWKNNELITEYAASRPGSTTWFRRAREVLGGWVGHDLRHFEPLPLYIQRGAGGRKWDVDGNEYIDYVGTWGPAILGHANPTIIEAVKNAAEQGTSFGIPNEHEIRMAQLVKKFMPSVGKIRMVNSGTEACMRYAISC